MYLPEVMRETVDSCISMAAAMSRRIIGCMCSSPCSRKACWRSTIERATLVSVSLRISRLLSSQRASCSWVRMRGVLGAAADQLGVRLVLSADPRQGGRIDLDRPAARGAPHEHVGHHVLGRGRADDRAGAGMAGAHQRQGLFEFVVGGAQLAAQRDEVAARPPGPDASGPVAAPRPVPGWPHRARSAAAPGIRSRCARPRPPDRAICTLGQHRGRAPRRSRRFPGAGWRAMSSSGSVR